MSRSSPVTSFRHSFTNGIQGPACDAAGNLYAVNYALQGLIGRVMPEDSVGNVIRFNAAGDMLIADYTGYNILRVDMQ